MRLAWIAGGRRIGQASSSVRFIILSAGSSGRTIRDLFCLRGLLEVPPGSSAGKFSITGPPRVVTALLLGKSSALRASITFDGRSELRRLSSPVVYRVTSRHSVRSDTHGLHCRQACQSPLATERLCRSARQILHATAHSMFICRYFVTFHVCRCRLQEWNMVQTQW